MGNKKKIRFIINPISGIGKQKLVEALVKKHLSKSDFEITFAYTNGPKHATILAKIAVEEQNEIVVAVGGDGSVNEVSEGLINSKVAFYILPAGSGNGFARHFNIPMNLQKAILALNNYRIEATDCGLFGKRHFANVAGVGFDAHICKLFANNGKRGFWAYLKIILTSYPKYKEQEYSLVLDGKAFTTKAFLITFANGSQYGNNAYIAPNACSNDGVMSVTIIKNVHWWNAAWIGFQLFTKRIQQSKNVLSFTFKSAEIRIKDDFAQVDGETISCERSTIVKILPLAINMVVPINN